MSEKGSGNIYHGHPCPFKMMARTLYGKQKKEKGSNLFGLETWDETNRKESYITIKRGFSSS